MKRVKITLHILICLLFSASTYAQNIFTRTQTYANPSWEHPALTGVNEEASLGLSYRLNINQTGAGLSAYEAGFNMPYSNNYDGSTDNSSFALSSKKLQEEIKNNKSSRRKHGFGANIRTLRFDNYQKSEFQLNYAYHLPIGNNLNLSMGANVIYGNTALNAEGLVVRDPANDELYQQIMADEGAFMNELYANVGLSLYTKQFLFTTTLTRINIMNNGNLNQDSDSEIAYQPKFMAGYSWSVSSKIHIIPTFSYALLAPYDNQLTASLRVNYNQLISLGMAMENDNKISALLGFKINRDFFLQYAYDTYRNYGKSISNGVHELNLTYLIKNKRATHPILW